MSSDSSTDAGTEQTEPMDSCWKIIGVYSRTQPTCPRLPEVIHCRNCDRFIAAGRHLLERELPEAYLEEWTRIMGMEKEESPPGTLSVLIFRIAGEWLALPTRLLSEIIDPQPFHSVPHRKNPALMGVVNVHGEIQLCVSLSVLLKLETPGEDKSGQRSYRRMVVVQFEGKEWVFSADEIFGIHRIHPDRFEETPVTVARSRSAFTRLVFRWEDRNVALLDEGLVFTSLKRGLM